MATPKFEQLSIDGDVIDLAKAPKGAGVASRGSDHSAAGTTIYLAELEARAMRARILELGEVGAFTDHDLVKRLGAGRPITDPLSQAKVTRWRQSLLAEGLVRHQQVDGVAQYGFDRRGRRIPVWELAR